MGVICHSRRDSPATGAASPPFPLCQAGVTGKSCNFTGASIKPLNAVTHHWTSILQYDIHLSEGNSTASLTHTQSYFPNRTSARGAAPAQWVPSAAQEHPQAKTQPCCLQPPQPWHPVPYGLQARISRHDLPPSSGHFIFTTQRTTSDIFEIFSVKRCSRLCSTLHSSHSKPIRVCFSYPQKHFNKTQRSSA